MARASRAPSVNAIAGELDSTTRGRMGDRAVQRFTRPDRRTRLRPEPDSITPAREKAVTFSEPYYTANEGRCWSRASDLDGITSLDQLKGRFVRGPDRYHQLRRRGRADRSLIRPEDLPTARMTSLRPGKQGQVDAIVVGLPTAIYLP